MIPFIKFCLFIIFRMLKIVLQLLLLVSYSLSDPEPEPDNPPGNLQNNFSFFGKYFETYQFSKAFSVVEQF